MSDWPIWTISGPLNTISVNEGRYIKHIRLISFLDFAMWWFVRAETCTKILSYMAKAGEHKTSCFRVDTCGLAELRKLLQIV